MDVVQHARVLIFEAYVKTIIFTARQWLLYHGSPTYIRERYNDSWFEEYVPEWVRCQLHHTLIGAYRDIYEAYDELTDYSDHDWDEWTFIFATLHHTQHCAGALTDKFDCDYFGDVLEDLVRDYEDDYDEGELREWINDIACPINYLIQRVSNRGIWGALDITPDDLDYLPTYWNYDIHDEYDVLTPSLFQLG